MNLFSSPYNYGEIFPHLDKAPIVEAVIDFQVVSIPHWDYKILQGQIQSRLPNYLKIEEGRGIKIDMLQHSQEDLGCFGLRATSSDGFYVAQFNRIGFTLSRVKKYEDWVTFCAEANKLWSLYRELLNPSGIKRIGVRYINSMVANYETKDFLSFFQRSPNKKQISGWDLENFLHRDVLRIPETEYRINLVKTIVSSPKKEKEVIAILDCDVFYNQEISCEWNDIAKHLKVMRWAKNKVFFKSIAKKKIKEYK